MAKIIHAKHTLNLTQKKKKKKIPLVTERKILMWTVYLSKSILQIISRVIQIFYNFFHENYGVPTIISLTFPFYKRKMTIIYFIIKKIIIFLSLHFTKYVAYHEWEVGTTVQCRGNGLAIHNLTNAQLFLGCWRFLKAGLA